MENRKLAKLALAALVLAANVPAGIQAHEEEKANETLLAAHACGSHCGAHRSEISDNSTPGAGAGSYGTSSNPYQTGSRGTSSSYGSTGSSMGAYNTGSSPSSTNPYSSASGSSAYGGSSGYGSSSDTSGRSSGSSSDWNTNPNTGKSSEWNTNRSYGSKADSDTFTSRYESYTTTPGAYGTTTSATMLMSDEEFKSHLDRDTKEIFDSLNRSGKDLAKTLANDPSYKDKNAAVKEAQKRTQGGSSMGSTTTTTRTTSMTR